MDRVAVSLAIRVETDLWASLPDAEAVVRRAVAAAASACGTVAEDEVSVVLVDDAAIRKLNSAWRGIEKPTNVLSFPAALGPAPTGRPPVGGEDGERAPALLGDIVIAFETTAGEAAADGKPLAHHLAHLAVHGFLHLLGYDHESDGDAEVMERLEASILARLEVPDPHTTCAHEA